jgi:hypothetical protein
MVIIRAGALCGNPVKINESSNLPVLKHYRQ